ncbi:hypothetical protein [Butyrivibrio fibrisolvens]|uniref:hypothetical protein n=1 Tax=Butyrivibrio fibrisolvens TaxID=831 RepID=UPI0003FCA996|nr:hypothetical protein [Butyrivibrio fibrisolvens]
MKEIGGYIEFETFHGQMLHDNAISLNCGRNCLAYLFKSRGIKKIKIPFFICSAIVDTCDREGVNKFFYHIGEDFRPSEDLILSDDEWLYLVNFYGQLTNEDIQEYIDKYQRVIVDQANDYFAEPISGVDTIYTCRKWFGVADGAFLYTAHYINDELPIDESFDRMRFLLGRYERSASEFYSEYSANNKVFATEPIKKMSKLTNNILHGIDYQTVKNKRRENYNYLHEKLKNINLLQPKNGLFMYPLMIENGAVIKKKLQERKIYIPTLWPTVFDITKTGDIEYKMAENILPLPIDQRYEIEDMKYIVEELLKCIG